MTNWQLIITLATLVLAIFGANGIFLMLANKRVDDLKMYLDARIETVLSEIRRVDQRISSLDQRTERIERQLETLFARFLPKSGD
jgi:hypothetical protein